MLAGGQAFLPFLVKKVIHNPPSSRKFLRILCKKLEAALYPEIDNPADVEPM
jgi:hypothetical protein